MIQFFPSFIVAYKFDSLLMSNHVFVCHLDLCRALVHVGPLEDLIQLQPNQINGGHQSRIQFSIINFDCVEINCIAYETVAEKLYENWFSSTAKVVVCVLKLW
ncbi:hypothetical protein Bca101_038982 [Brassica carinata]